MIWVNNSIGTICGLCGSWHLIAYCQTLVLAAWFMMEEWSFCPTHNAVCFVFLWKSWSSSVKSHQTSHLHCHCWSFDFNFYQILSLFIST